MKALKGILRFLGLMLVLSLCLSAIAVVLNSVYLATGSNGRALSLSFVAAATLFGLVSQMPKAALILVATLVGRRLFSRKLFIVEGLFIGATAGFAFGYPHYLSDVKSYGCAGLGEPLFTSPLAPGLQCSDLVVSVIVGVIAGALSGALLIGLRVSRLGGSHG